MESPPRLRDDGPEDLRALLRAGAPTRPMTPQQRARTARRLARYASAAAVAATLSWVPGAAFGAGLGVATVLVAWGVPAWLASTRPPPAPSPPVVTPSPSPPAVSSAIPEAPLPRPGASAETTDPVPPAPAPSTLLPSTPLPSPSPAASEAPSGAPADPLAEEVALLDRARASLAADPAGALALTEGHAARFPAGKLGLEREMVAVDALRRLGRMDEARARAEAMLARTQGSLYEPRVRKLLDGMR